MGATMTLAQHEVLAGKGQVETAVRATLNIRLQSLQWDDGGSFDTSLDYHSLIVTCADAQVSLLFSRSALERSMQYLSIETVRLIHQLLVDLRTDWTRR
jgi:hypothetical protein